MLRGGRAAFKARRVEDLGDQDGGFGPFARGDGQDELVYFCCVFMAHCVFPFCVIASRAKQSTIERWSVDGLVMLLVAGKAERELRVLCVLRGSNFVAAPLCWIPAV